MRRIFTSITFLFCVSLCNVTDVTAREITFCGESIPVSNDFVAQKLMNVIKRQMPYVNMPHLRRSAEKYFPIVEEYLRATGLPEDFKYLPIVESGFANATSIVGAQGFWQIMPDVAKELGLMVSINNDERNDIHKSTLAACRHLASYYMMIRKKYKISSWVLTAAAYNVGIGSIYNSINRQGKDYFSMKLNPETAVYVYKIIAVKELFEYPELYMKNFSYNVFSSTKPLPKLTTTEVVAPAETEVFTSMEVKVKEDDGQHPDIVAKSDGVEKLKPISLPPPKKIKLVPANIKGKYKNFTDGGVITIELQKDLIVKNAFKRGGNIIKGIGWIINDRVFIDLGYDDHDVILYDSNSKQGILLDDLKNNEPLLLKVQTDEE